MGCAVDKQGNYNLVLLGNGSFREEVDGKGVKIRYELTNLTKKEANGFYTIIAGAQVNLADSGIEILNSQAAAEMKIYDSKGEGSGGKGNIYFQGKAVGLC